jgi:hypothetical protein
VSPGRNITAGGTSDSLLGTTRDESCRPIELAPSFLQPLDHPIPMIAIADIAQMATDLLNQTWTGVRIVELEALGATQRTILLRQVLVPRLASPYERSLFHVARGRRCSALRESRTQRFASP